MLRQYPECARQAREAKESHESFLLILRRRNWNRDRPITEAATPGSKVPDAENAGDDRSE